VSESAAAARDTAFAAVALLRCRDRMTALLNAVAEPRRSELARAVAQHEQFDDAHLKQILARVIRHQHETVRESAAQVLGGAIARAPRVVRVWLAQEAER
jgi:hypothetical protein